MIYATQHYFLVQFLMHWGMVIASLWVASYLFRGLSFDNLSAMLIGAMVLVFANAVVRPLLILLTFPLTLLSLGLFLFVLNAVILQMVASMVKGFHLKSFWTALWLSIFIAILMGFFDSLLPEAQRIYIPSNGAVLI